MGNDSPIPVVSNTSTTTLANTGRVTAYTSFGSGVIYMLDKRTGLNLDNIEYTVCTIALTAAAAFIWNRLKDSRFLRDNR